MTARARSFLDRELARVLESEAPVGGESWLIAFSGGPDSLALAGALGPPARARGVELRLVHVDHRIDAGSEVRARRAGELAAELGLPFSLATRDVPAERRRGESPEAAARRVRYEALEGERVRLGATKILTAHHRDDQIETLLLRLLAGGPLEDLAGIAERRGALLRPLLRVPRREIESFLREAGLEPIADPSNLDSGVPRNRIRGLLLPHLRAAEPGFEEALLAVAQRVEKLRGRLDRIFSDRLAETPSEGDLPAAAVLALPGELRAGALRWYLRARTECRMPSSPSLEAFLAALGSSRRGRAELRLAGGRWRLTAREGRILLEPFERPESRSAPFSYTSGIPGEVELPELGLRFRIRRSGVEPWMFRGDPKRAALALGAVAAPTATVRSRQPGDRLRPLGGPGERKLKEILIDRGVPAHERDRLPILEIDGRIAWVPGVTIEDRFRLGDERECWQVELEPSRGGGNGPEPGPVGTHGKEPR